MPATASARGWGIFNRHYPALTDTRLLHQQRTPGGDQSRGAAPFAELPGLPGGVGNPDVAQAPTQAGGAGHGRSRGTQSQGRAPRARSGIQPCLRAKDPPPLEQMAQSNGAHIQAACAAGSRALPVRTDTLRIRRGAAAACRKEAGEETAADLRRHN